MLWAARWGASFPHGRYALSGTELGIATTELACGVDLQHWHRLCDAGFWPLEMLSVAGGALTGEVPQYAILLRARYAMSDADSDVRY
eukprot:2946030-Rhodomonas_salina.3